MPFANDIISIINVISTVILAIVIFLIGSWLDKRSQKRGLRLATLGIAQDSFRRIDENAGRKTQIEKEKEIDSMSFDFHTIEQNGDIQTCVFAILNEYEMLARFLSEGLLDDTVILIREKAMQSTYKQYEKYILDYRSVYKKKDAWKYFERYYKDRLSTNGSNCLVNSLGSFRGETR